jgi:hypothetical protein
MTSAIAWSLLGGSSLSGGRWPSARCGRFHTALGSSVLNAANSARSAGVQLPTSNLPLQHRQLVAKQQDLDLLLPLRAKTQHHELQQPLQRPVQKRQNDPCERPTTGADPTGQTRASSNKPNHGVTGIFGTHTVFSR